MEEVNDLEIIEYWGELLEVNRSSYEDVKQVCDEYNETHSTHQLNIFVEIFDGEENLVLYDIDQYYLCQVEEPFLHFVGAKEEPVHLPIGIKCLYMTFANLGATYDYSQITEKETSSVMVLKNTWSGNTNKKLDLSTLVFNNVEIVYEAFADALLLNTLVLPKLPNVKVLYKMCYNSQQLRYVDITYVACKHLANGVIDEPFGKCEKLYQVFCSDEIADTEVAELIMNNSLIQYAWGNYGSEGKCLCRNCAEYNECKARSDSSIVCRKFYKEIEDYA